RPGASAHRRGDARGSDRRPAGDQTRAGRRHDRLARGLDPRPVRRGARREGVGETAAGGADCGRTWWGRAWLEALEQRARLDPDRLPRGRDYARSGTVGELTLAPGEARARGQGRKTEPYEVRI